MSNTTIDVRTQKDIQKSAVSRDKFPVDFGRAWKWIGYSRKDIAKDALLRQFADSVDFKSFPVETGNRGRRREQIMLTRDCFKKFCMMAGTEKGREVREYYLKCESELHSIKEKGAMRTKSKVVRNFYTDTLQSHGITKKHEFIQLTSQPKQILGLDKKKKRDDYSMVELMKVIATEATASANIIQQDADGYVEIKPIVHHAAEGIAALLTPPVQALQSA